VAQKRYGVGLAIERSQVLFLILEMALLSINLGQVADTLVLIRKISQRRKSGPVPASCDRGLFYRPQHWLYKLRFCSRPWNVDELDTRKPVSHNCETLPRLSLL